MNDAGALQRNLQCTPPEIRGASVLTLQRPAGPVCGDVFELVRIDDNHVALAVADASGHDLAAGLLAVFVSGLIRSMAASHPERAKDPRHVLGALDRALSDARIESGHFVTAIYGVLDERNQILEWARAGAPHPVLIGRDGSHRRLRGGGSLLGHDLAAPIDVVRTHLALGDTFLVFTDGFEEECARSFARTGQHSIESRLDACGHVVTLTDSLGRARDDVTAVALTARRPSR